MSTRKAAPQLRTPGVIADELGEPLHRVAHVLATRSHIRPAARAGNLRVYLAEAVEQVRKELEAIDRRRIATHVLPLGRQNTSQGQKMS